MYVLSLPAGESRYENAFNKVKQKQRKQKYVAAVLYRIPIPVTKILVFLHGDSYPVCPRCDCTVDREYMRFCDRCGQRLGWKRIDRAEIIYAPCKENR